MVRPKDPLWKHVHQLENSRFLCKFCYGQFVGGITRIKSHLSGRKGNDIKVCEKVPQDVQLEVLQVLETPNEKERQVSVSKKKRKDRQVENENYSIPSSSGGPNLVLMGKKICKLFYSFGVQPTLIFSPIFEDFLKSVVEYGPSAYKLASAFTDSLEFHTEVFSENADYIKNFKKDSVQEGCSLMVNIKQPLFERGVYVDIFAYSKKGAACFGSHKYQRRLGGVQEFICSKIDLELCHDNLHVVQLLLSGNGYGDVLDQELELLKIKNYYNWICVSNCAAFEIEKFSNMMNSVLFEVIAPVRFMFNTYHYYKVSSTIGTKRPKEKFAYLFLVLKTVLQIEDELQGVPFSSIIEARDRVTMLDEKEKAKHLRCAKLIDYIVGSKEFWCRVKAVEQVWFLLLQTQCLVTCVDSSIGYLYQMIERLKDGIEKSRKYDHFVYDQIWEKFIQLRSKILHPIHAAAAFLDPAYMCTKNFVENHEMINGTKYMLENMVDSNEKEDFEKELDQYRKELPTLTTAQAMLKKFHPRTWWDMCGKHTPVLRKYAIRILAQPCSASLCKQYKMLGGSWSKDRAEKVNTMIINRNSKLLELEPIIFDKLVEDHDAFKDQTELDIEWYIGELFLKLSSDAVVNFMINYPSPPFWDDVYKIFWLFVPSSGL